MSSRFKMLLLDLDGTTVGPSRESLPSAPVIQAIQKAQSKLHVALATGRTFEDSRAVINVLDLKGSSVLSGGAYIIDVASEHVIHRELLSVETLREVAAIGLRFHHHVFAADIQRSKTIKAPNEITEPAAMLVVEGVDEQQVVGILKEVKTLKDVVAHTANSWSGEHLADIHITHVRATKLHAVQLLIEHLGLVKSEVIAIGDSHNDLPLLEAAGFKVAMGGAPNELKAIADYVAPSFKQDGVADAIEHFILAEPK